jgi:hypothetical protein
MSDEPWLVDRNEAFRIRVDGAERSSVYPYQHVDFQIAEGRHGVAVPLDDLRPKSIAEVLRPRG